MILGIDPGMTTGLAYLFIDKVETYSVRRDDVISCLSEGPKPSLVIVEKQAPISPSKKACWETGYSQGLIEAYLRIMAVPYMLVLPQVWQSKVIGKIKKGETKIRVKEYILQRFPDGIKRNEHENDALALASYGSLIQSGLQK